MSRHDEVRRSRETENVVRESRTDELDAHLAKRIEDGRRQRGTNIGYEMNFENPFHIHPEIIPYGFEYRWACTHIRGEETPERVASLRRQGWDFVPRHRHPELCDDTHSPIGDSDWRKNYIHKAGQVLMDKPKVFCDEDREKLRNHNKAQLNTPALQHMIGTDKNETTFGSGKYF